MYSILVKNYKILHIVVTTNKVCKRVCVCLLAQVRTIQFGERPKPQTAAYSYLIKKLSSSKQSNGFWNGYFSGNISGGMHSTDCFLSLFFMPYHPYRISSMDSYCKLCVHPLLLYFSFVVCVDSKSLVNLLVYVYAVTAVIHHHRPALPQTITLWYLSRSQCLVFSPYLKLRSADCF